MLTWSSRKCHLFRGSLVPRLFGLLFKLLSALPASGKQAAHHDGIPILSTSVNQQGKHHVLHRRITLRDVSVTHLHNDTVPKIGGDTLWASGYAAYEKLSPGFRAIIDGRSAVYRSAHPYLDRSDPTLGPKYVERTHPLVRVHPATGWKALWVNRAMTDRIVGLDRAESDVILNYLYDVYEQNVDIQVRFKWTPGTSALWDNRITIHNASWDYEGNEPRHGTRVTSLAEKPVFKADAPTRRQALGLAGPEDV